MYFIYIHTNINVYMFIYARICICMYFIYTCIVHIYLCSHSFMCVWGYRDIWVCRWTWLSLSAEPREDIRAPFHHSPPSPLRQALFLNLELVSRIGQEPASPEDPSVSTLFRNGNAGISRMPGLLCGCSDPDSHPVIAGLALLTPELSLQHPYIGGDHSFVSQLRKA